MQISMWVWRSCGIFGSGYVSGLHYQNSALQRCSPWGEERYVWYICLLLCPSALSHQLSAQSIAHGRTRSLQTPPPHSCTQGSLPDWKVQFDTLFYAKCLQFVEWLKFLYHFDNIKLRLDRHNLQLRASRQYKLPRVVLDVSDEYWEERKPSHRHQPPQ